MPQSQGGGRGALGGEVGGGGQGPLPACAALIRHLPARPLRREPWVQLLTPSVTLAISQLISLRPGLRSVKWSWR